MSDPPPSLWVALGLSPLSEVHEGHQSRVFVASHQGDQVIVKLIEASDTQTFVRERVEVSRQLAEINPAVVGPVDVGSGLVTEIDRWHVICYPYVRGAEPDTSNRDDVEAMAATLATLHRSLATLPTTELPVVAALQGTTDDRLRRGQLIHGDFTNGNLIRTPTGLRVIDFADCGYGSVAFEIGNSLYSILFDAWNTDRLERYEQFRSWFVNAYPTVGAVLDDAVLDDALLDAAIQVRVKALDRWLGDLATAPTGIRTASVEWRERLRLFINHTMR